MSRPSDQQRKPHPVPEFYRPEHAGDPDYRPDLATLRQQAAEIKSACGEKGGTSRKKGGTSRSATRGGGQVFDSKEDDSRIVLLVIDAQKDFCLPTGSLFVGGRSGRGAVDDSDRLCRFIYRHLGLLSEIVCTLDTHQPFQIFFPEFWLDEHGAAPQANREIDAASIARGELRPHPEVARHLGVDLDWLERQVLDYCRQLEQDDRHKLFLWPPHCLLGGDGHCLTGVVQEAWLFHSFVHSAPNRLVSKGDQPLTENYSVFAPEVRSTHDGAPLGVQQQDLLDDLLTADRVLVAGQAASHCVRSSLEDLVAAAERSASGDPSRIYLLEDCCSSVAVPAADGSFLFDFTDATLEALRRLESQGLQRVASTEPVEDWPGFVD